MLAVLVIFALAWANLFTPAKSQAQPQNTKQEEIIQHTTENLSVPKHQIYGRSNSFAIYAKQRGLLVHQSVDGVSVPRYLDSMHRIYIRWQTNGPVVNPHLDKSVKNITCRSATEIYVFYKSETAKKEAYTFLQDFVPAFSETESDSNHAEFSNNVFTARWKSPHKRNTASDEELAAYLYLGKKNFGCNIQSAFFLIHKIGKVKLGGASAISFTGESADLKEVLKDEFKLEINPHSKELDTQEVENKDFYKIKRVREFEDFDLDLEEITDAEKDNSDDPLTFTDVDSIADLDVEEEEEISNDPATFTSVDSIADYEVEDEEKTNPESPAEKVTKTASNNAENKDPDDSASDEEFEEEEEEDIFGLDFFEDYEPDDFGEDEELIEEDAETDGESDETSDSELDLEEEPETTLTWRRESLMERLSRYEWQQYYRLNSPLYNSKQRFLNEYSFLWNLKEMDMEPLVPLLLLSQEKNLTVRCEECMFGMWVSLRGTIEGTLTGLKYNLTIGHGAIAQFKLGITMNVTKEAKKIQLPLLRLDQNELLSVVGLTEVFPSYTLDFRMEFQPLMQSSSSQDADNDQNVSGAQSAFDSTGAASSEEGEEANTKKETEEEPRELAAVISLFYRDVQTNVIESNGSPFALRVTPHKNTKDNLPQVRYSVQSNEDQWKSRPGVQITAAIVPTTSVSLHQHGVEQVTIALQFQHGVVLGIRWNPVICETPVTFEPVVFTETMLEIAVYGIVLHRKPIQKIDSRGTQQSEEVDMLMNQCAMDNLDMLPLRERNILMDQEEEIASEWSTEYELPQKGLFIEAFKTSFLKDWPEAALPSSSSDANPKMVHAESAAELFAALDIAHTTVSAAQSHVAKVMAVMDQLTAELA